MLSVQSEIVEGLAPLPSPQKVLPKLKSSKSGLMFPVNLGRAVEIMKNSQTLNFGVFFSVFIHSVGSTCWRYGGVLYWHPTSAG